MQTTGKTSTFLKLERERGIKREGNRSIKREGEKGIKRERERGYRERDKGDLESL
jgi:hypothetical protein